METEGWLTSIWSELYEMVRQWHRDHRIQLNDPVDSRAFFAAVRAMAHLLLIRRAGLPDDRMETTFPFISCGRREDGRYYLSWMDEVILFDMDGGGE